MPDLDPPHAAPITGDAGTSPTTSGPGEVVVERHGTRMLACAADGPPLAGERDATDLVGVALSEGVDLVTVPVGRLTAEFFTLRTGIAGQIVQKLVMYRLRLAVVGDISRQLGASPTLRDFVAESNRGQQVWFVPDLAELDARLLRRLRSK